MDRVPSTQRAKLQGKLFLIEDQEFSLGHVQVKLSIRHPSRESSGKLDNVSMDFRSNTWTVDINLETIVIRLVFKAMSSVQSLDVCTQRKVRDQGLSLRHASMKN